MCQQYERDGSSKHSTGGRLISAAAAAVWSTRGWTSCGLPHTPTPHRAELVGFGPRAAAYADFSRASSRSYIATLSVTPKASSVAARSERLRLS